MRGAVVTARCRRAAGHSNGGGSSSTRRGGYNIYESRSSFIGIERSLALYAGRDNKEAARTGCLFANLTNGESLESFL